MKLRIEEGYPGEFDDEPEVLEARAIEAAQEAVLQMMNKAFRSHDNMPKVGDRVKNTNPGCIHYKSEGVVIQLKDLPGGKGRTIKYKCTNSGPKWNKGDTLEKTPDQLSPLKMSKAYSDIANSVDGRRGGEIDALDDIAEMMRDLYSERLDRLKLDIKKEIEGP